MEIGNWKLETGNWKLEIGYWILGDGRPKTEVEVEVEVEVSSFITYISSRIALIRCTSSTATPYSLVTTPFMA